MENRAHALIVGFVALLLTGAIIAVVWWFGGGGEEYRIYELETHKGVTGLTSQAAVRFRGVRVGRVMAIDLDDSDPHKVVVRIRVRQDVPITYGTVATLGFQGLTGNAFIQLDDSGKDPRPLLPVGEDVARIALQPGLVDQASETGRRVVGRLDEASQGVAHVLRAENLERIDKALQNIAASTTHLEKTLAQMPALVKDVRAYASPEAAAELQSAVREVSKATKQLPGIIDNWNRAIGKIDAAGARIDRLGSDLQGGLVADTLPRINALSTELQGTSAQINGLLGDLQRSPQMLLMGREAPPPGPGEAATK
ncbi:MlaD family protein [Viridibacterium curvum]|uniref:MlaD family protein n=1 Tax=Viridibacterium curvum TaxID=1101404 RepID=A0ABP9QB72_9RHOO